MKKLLVLALAVTMTLFTAQAWAGEDPEYDAVNCDNTNFFARDVVHNIVTANAYFNGKAVEFYSNYPVVILPTNLTRPYGYPDPTNGVKVWGEQFYQTAGQASKDVCFGAALQSYLVSASNGAVFEWFIVLQKKPATDLDIVIHECVMKNNSQTLFGTSPYSGAWQTGRILSFLGGSTWNAAYNPRVTVRAYPGPVASTGFTAGVVLNGRLMPTLAPVLLQDALFTSKGLWSETIVAAKPETGSSNGNGAPLYNLKQGDVIDVRVELLDNFNAADVRFAKDSVLVEYVGEFNNYYLTDTTDACGTPPAQP